MVHNIDYAQRHIGYKKIEKYIVYRDGYIYVHIKKMDKFDIEIIINAFNDRLCDLIKEYIILPENKPCKELEAKTYRDFSSSLSALVNKMDGKRVDRIRAFDEIYRFLYANKKYISYPQTAKLRETAKKKIAEVYLDGYNSKNRCEKYYLEKLGNIHYTNIFGDTIRNYIVDRYLSNEKLDFAETYLIKKYIVETSGTEKYVVATEHKDNKIGKNGAKKCSRFLTYTEADNLRRMIIHKMKSKLMKIKTERDKEFLITKINNLVKEGADDLNSVDILHLGIDGDLLKDIFKTKSSGVEERPLKYLFTDDVSLRMRLKLYSKYSEINDDTPLVDRIYKNIFDSDISECHSDKDLFKYFLANKKTFSESECKNISQSIYNYCINKIKKEYMHDEKTWSISHIKLQIYINYHYGNMDEDNKNMYREYCEAIFDKPFEFDYGMAVTYIMSKYDDTKNNARQNYNLVEENEEFRYLLINTILG